MKIPNKVYAFGCIFLVNLAWSLPLIGAAPYTQKQRFGDIQELWKNAQIQGFVPLEFDIQNQEDLQTGFTAPKASHLKWKKESDSVAFAPLLGYEIRHLESSSDTTTAWDGGVYIEGAKGPMSFWTDARIFTEFHTLENAKSFDREFIEKQKEGSASGVENTYISYARYRGALEFQSDFGRLGFRRDAFSWGPASYYNLTFNNNAIPFAHLYYQAELGPVRVMSLWGRLQVPGNKEFGYSDKTRSVYAHRYEWSVTPNWILGLSEQLIIYEGEAFAALFPIVPLFMEKGQNLEENNNGNIAFDMSYRFGNHTLIYGEFFLDDLQEPTTLFNNFWGNRWATTVGIRNVQSLNLATLSSTAEWSRVEPWVYTHYYPNTAQVSNNSIPLGHPLGPNSMSLIFAQKLQNFPGWGLGWEWEWTWKGKDRGSNSEDPINLPHDPGPKTFLANANPEWSFKPSFYYNWKQIGLESKIALKENVWDGYLRVMIQY